MTDEEINKAIAEHLGYKRGIRPADCRTPLAEFWIHPEGSENWDPPKFCGDLNACEEFEKTLDVNISSGDSPRYAYARHLYEIVSGDCQPFRASARQRAEAFLRTVGKWKENE